MKLPSNFQIGDKIIFHGEIAGITFLEGQINYNISIKSDKMPWPFIFQGVPSSVVSEESEGHSKSDKE